MVLFRPVHTTSFMLLGIHSSNTAKISKKYKYKRLLSNFQPLCCWWLIWSTQNYAKNLKNDRNPINGYLKVLSKSYPMNTNMTWLGWLSKKLHPYALDESSLSIERVKNLFLWDYEKIFCS